MNQCTIDFGVDPKFLLLESLWQAIEPLLPAEPTKPYGGRPRMPDRQAFCAMFYLCAPACNGKPCPAHSELPHGA